MVESCEIKDCEYDGQNICLQKADADTWEGCAWAARDLNKKSFTFVKHDSSCYTKMKPFDDFCKKFDSGVISGEAAYPDK